MIPPCATDSPVSAASGLKSLSSAVYIGGEHQIRRRSSIQRPVLGLGGVFSFVQRLRAVVDFGGGTDSVSCVEPAEVNR